MKAENRIAFYLDGKMMEIDFEREHRWGPTTTVLNFLRSLPNQKGTKEGCAEGDCGACTVVIAEPNADGQLTYRAIDSCLVFLPMIDGKQLISVENLGSSSNLHPVQKAMVDCDGSQCGYCTPGFVMSLFALYKSEKEINQAEIMDGLTGNLCRCTGYRSILEAANSCCKTRTEDQFSAEASSVSKVLQTHQIAQSDLDLNDGNTHYLRPKSLKSALELRAKYPTALIVCGGTDVGLMVTKRKMQLPTVLDLSGIPETNFSQELDGGLKIGATTNLELVKGLVQNRFPALFEMLAVFGSRQIREQGTLGGNIANASPIGDMPPVLMALDAQVELQSINGTRTLPIEEFITGYRTTDLKPTELITAVLIPDTPLNKIVKSYKVSKRKDLDISTVSAGFYVELDPNENVKDIGLIYGGMAAMTKHASLAEDFLLNNFWTRENIEHAMMLIDQEFSPISDARSGKEGRRIMARNLLLKFWADTNERKELVK